MEKCYREIQSRGEIAGVNILEMFILIAFPIVLFPFFTLLDWNVGIILMLDILLYFVFRIGNKVSHFDHGLTSFVFSKFVWPQKLSAFGLDERTYLKDEDASAGAEKWKRKISGNETR